MTRKTGGRGRVRGRANRLWMTVRLPHTLVGRSKRVKITNTPYWRQVGRRVVADKESAYNTSKASSGEMVGYLLGVTDLNYVGHRACIREESVGARKERE